MARYEVRLSACGNSDFGEDPCRLVCRPQVKRGNSIEEMQKIVRSYIASNGLGSGNIALVDVVDLENDEVVGQVSYNGRFWPGGYKMGQDA